MTISSAPISNLQFRPRRAGSANANVPASHKTMDVPKLTTRSGSLAIKRNARSGKMTHWAGRL